MEKLKVLYLDDEKESLIHPIKAKLELDGQLEIILEKPKSFEIEIDRLANELKKCDAIILDLQLDGPQEDIKNEAGEVFQVKYQAPPLAQMIRTMASACLLEDIPIVLCSTEIKIKGTFSRDFTSHDLFDWTFLKDDINSETIDKIVSLISAYRVLKEKKNNYTDILNRDISEVDERILSRFSGEENPITHEIARVIFKDIVQPNGILIDESTLAARLGIDISKSKEEWIAFEEKHLQSTRYNGIYCNSWRRWWNDRVIDVFEEITTENLPSLDAKSRVELLVEKTDFKNLKVAKPIELYESSFFWNICEITKKPLDPFEGFKINFRNEPKPWQDYFYVSLFAIVAHPDLITKKGIKVHPTDIERLAIERKKID